MARQNLPKLLHEIEESVLHLALPTHQEKDDAEELSDEKVQNRKQSNRTKEYVADPLNRERSLVTAIVAIPAERLRYDL